MSREESRNDWVSELERNKQGAYIGTVSGPNFLARFPLGLPPEEFVDQLAADLGKTPSESERTQFINELTANNTSSGRASVLRKIDASREGESR